MGGEYLDRGPFASPWDGGKVKTGASALPLPHLRPLPAVPPYKGEVDSMLPGARGKGGGGRGGRDVFISGA